MNKHCFRVIFNKTTQRFEAVSELAKANGQSKSSANGQKSSTILKSFLKSPALFAQIKPLSFALFCALGFVSLAANAEVMFVHN